MNSKINITEEDIFLFIKNPGQLTSEKKVYIEENQELFKNGIELFQSFSNDLNENEISELDVKIEQKIFGDRNNTVILTPTWNPQSETSEVIRLAAASIKLKKKTDAISYADSDSKYLVRVIENNGKKLLYLLMADDITPPRKIKLQPSGNEHIINDPVEPIDVTDESLIESIIVLKIF